MEALLVPSYSRHCQHRLACLHAGLIAKAQSRVYLTSPYFGPGIMVDEALQAAAIRGVDVRLLVPRRGDPLVAGWATQAAYAPLLAAGVRVLSKELSLRVECTPPTLPGWKNETLSSTSKPAGKSSAWR
jgi:cardiolipin synthase